MNRHKNIKMKLSVLLLLFPLIITTSCKKELLNTEPKTSISEDNAFDTPARILGQINGLYDGVKAGDFFGSRYLIYNDIRGEEFINRLNNGVTGLQTWSYNITSSTNEVENLWIAGYAAINRINVFLKGLDDNASKIDASMLLAYKAEAKFLRGLSYFSLLTIYARPYTLNNGASPGLPLRLKAEKNIENNDLARSSVKEVYQQVLADLNEAENNLPGTYSSSDLNVTRAHKNSAIALKTRVYLSMGQYNDVIAEAQKIVSNAAPYQATNGVLHKLETNAITPFVNYTTTESIFSFPMTAGDPPGTQNQLAYYYNKPGVGNGEYFLNTKGILADTSWKPTDARKINFIVLDGGNSYLKKFNAPAPFTDYVPVLRYAEILLNYAEAAAKTGDLTKSADLLKAVRNRSDASYVFSPATVATQDELVKAILIEKRIEFLGEGFRSIDLLRLGMTIPAKGSVNAVQPSQSEYIWPIPNSEMLTNKLMVQN
ncbi:MAG: RagB/SusD family nutrient uptake outer membrane protein [Bacteroidia bacterium]